MGSTKSFLGPPGPPTAHLWFSSHETPPRAPPGQVYGHLSFQVLEKLLPGESASLVMVNFEKYQKIGILVTKYVKPPFPGFEWTGIVVYFEITTSKPEETLKCLSQVVCWLKDATTAPRLTLWPFVIPGARKALLEQVRHLGNGIVVYFEISTSKPEETLKCLSQVVFGLNYATMGPTRWTLWPFAIPGARKALLEQVRHLGNGKLRKELSFLSKLPPQNQRTPFNASPRWFSGYRTPPRPLQPDFVAVCHSRFSESPFGASPPPGR
ncbi:unnamed protein product [Orchesella dallaii]|uniref:Uncharacterized protein n=1 Tax=Orchesella dallaii TaxID=48710 RepID=A0ABP1RNN1_9HEXA